MKKTRDHANVVRIWITTPVIMTMGVGARVTLFPKVVAIRGPCCASLMEIHKLLEKSPKRDNYDGIGDPYERVEPIETMLDYHHIRSVVNCMLFVMTLKDATMTWFKNLPGGYINSWKKLCNSFTTQFMVRKWKPKIIAILNVV